ncbi:MAG: hypothetical protein ACK5PF_01190 [bacterium]
MIDPRLVALQGLEVPLSPIALAVQGLIAEIEAGLWPPKPADGGGGSSRRAAKRAARVSRRRLLDDDDAVIMAIVSAVTTGALA